MLRTLLLVLAAVAALAAIPAGASAATCKLPQDGKGFGPTYLLSLKTTKASCDQGKAVVKAFHACATAHGTKGRCAKKVLGYACTEKRTSGLTEIDGNVTCAKGSARVRFTYSQFT